MKSKFLLIPFVTGVLHLSAQQAVITLENPLPGNETHIVVARDEVRMINGFTYSPNTGHHFHAYTNEDMVLPVIYAAIPIVVDDRELNTDLPVGTTAGSHSVSLTGAATYQVPLLIPPGTAGMEPSVSVVYNSQAGNGLLGYGWNLAGLSSITRIGHTIYHDGKVKGVNFDDDRFAMDGNRLVLINGEYGEANSEYYTENFNASKIKAHGSAIGGGPLYFTVQTKDGKTIEYGNTDNSRVETVSSMASYVITWNINKITDRKGNYIEYVYHKSDDHTQYWIEEIRYTGNEMINPELEPYNTIHFYYSERTDKHTTYIAGSKLQSNVLLDHIKVFAGSSLVRNYKFGYHYDFYSRLIEIKEFNGLGQRYNSTVFEYFDQEIQFDTVNLPVQYSTMNYSYGDFTGDGRMDFATYPKIPLSGAEWRLFKNDGSFGFDLINYGILTQNIHNIYGGEYSFFSGEQNITITTNGFNYVSARLSGSNSVDFNGDGYDDLLWREDFEEPGIDPFYGYLFALYNPQTESFGNPDVALYTQVDHVLFMGDFNGDKKTDLFSSEYNDSNYKWNLSTIGWKSESQVPYIENGIIGDFNGNGKVDLLTTRPDRGIIYEYDEEIQSFSSPIFSGGYPTSYHTILSADFNGDGTSEIFTWVSGSGWEVYQICPITSSLVPTIELPALPSLNGGSKVFVQDINGDGFSDIITLKIEYSYGWHLYLNIYYSNGNEFFHFGRGITVFGLSNTNLDNAEIIFGDFTGDGNIEIKISKDTYYHQIIIPPKKVNMNNVIKKIADGINNIKSFEYEQITNDEIYDKGEYEPFSNSLTLKSGLSVVSSLSINPDTDDEIITSFYYQAARIHNQGKGFLGFSAITNSRALSGFSDPTWLNVRNSYKLVETKSGDFEHFIVVPDSVINRIKREIERDAIYGYETVSESAFSYDYKNVYCDPDGLVVMPYLISSTLTDRQKDDLTIISGYEVDDYGNILTENINYNGEGTTIIETVYTDNGSWCDYLPDYVTVTKTRNGETPYTNETDYIYRADGLPETIRSFMHLANPADETFGYDDFGNITSKTISASGEIPRTETFEYDVKHRFVTEKTNILGYSSFYAYDHRTGNLLNSTDIQGLKTIFSYDGFGRKKGIKYPDGNYTDISRVWNIAGDILFYTQQQTSGAPMQRTFYDKLGREMLSAYEDYNSNTVYAKTLYDANGRVESVSEPFFEGDTPEQWTTYYYDETGRIEQVDFPTHTETTNYVGMTTTVTNLANGISKSTTTDAFGLTVAVTDPTGTINYDYYSHGKPRAITAPDGSVFSITYDDYLRQATLNDPDAGTVNYEEYTGFGELKRQVHAGHTTETQYDAFGRPDIITYSFDGQSESLQYEYVEEGNGLGQVESITQSNGIGYHYTYDQYGRIKTESEIIEGQTYQSGYTYDSYGNLYKLTYPSGFSVKNEYDRGYLTKQRRGDNNAVLYELPDYNVRGQITEFKYGNGLPTLLDYDDYGFPDMFLVQSGGTLNLNYGFDPGTGNLNWRNDHTYRLNLHESFSYDDNHLKNRLTGWGEDEQEQFSILYENNGNIRYKTDVTNNTDNSFKYNSSRPHAVTILDNVKQEYLDFVEGRDQTIVYNAFDKTQSITQGNKRLEFVYGPDQSRKIMKYYEKEGGNFVLKKTKYYILGNTEKEVDNVTGETRTLNYIGEIAIFEQTSSGNYLYYLHKDYQGTTLAVTDASGSVVHRYAYDPWGRRRDPVSWRNYTATEIEQQNFLFTRGYTGHEHLDAFGLINMNGRMYDPLLGRMLSPDNYVQAPENSQNFNRYSYAMNNPLVYVDPDGEWVHLVIGGIIGGTMNWLAKGAEFNAKGLGYFGVGLLAGALGSGVANGIGAAMVPGSSQTFLRGFVGIADQTATGAIAGGLSGAGSGFTLGFLTGFGNEFLDTDGKANLKDAINKGINIGILASFSGAYYGAWKGATDAISQGNDWLTGSTYKIDHIANETNFKNVNDFIRMSKEQQREYMTQLSISDDPYDFTIHAPNETKISNMPFHNQLYHDGSQISASANYQGNYFAICVNNSPNGGSVGIPVTTIHRVQTFNGTGFFGLKIFSIQSKYSILFNF